MTYRKTIIAYILSGTAGLLIWLGFMFLTEGPDAWDSGEYFFYGWPLMMVIAGLLGAFFPVQPWRWVIMMVSVQFFALVALSDGSGNLLPVSLSIFTVVAAPCVAAAYLGAYLKRRARTDGDEQA